MSGVSEFPVELETRLVTFDETLSSVEEILKNFQKVPYSELYSQLTSLDKAKLDLIGTYAINSLFWMYLSVRGENPKEHAVKQELSRIQSYMGRVKEIQDKQLAPRLNVDASKRFVRNALWEAAHKTSTPIAVKRPSSEKAQTLNGEVETKKKKHKRNR